MENVTSENILSAFRILKSVTLFVKSFPFIYAALYIFLFLLQLLVSEDAYYLVSNIVFISPITIVAFICLSFKLKMCVWHRAQCALPLIPQAISIIDSYFYEFGEYSILILIFAIVFMIIASLIHGYLCFIR